MTIEEQFTRKDHQQPEDYLRKLEARHNDLEIENTQLRADHEKLIGDIDEIISILESKKKERLKRSDTQEVFLKTASKINLD